jgi:hypothetical protein
MRTVAPADEGIGNISVVSCREIRTAYPGPRAMKSTPATRPRLGSNRIGSAVSAD